MIPENDDLVPQVTVVVLKRPALLHKCSRRVAVISLTSVGALQQTNQSLGPELLPRRATPAPSADTCSFTLPRALLW